MPAPPAELVAATRAGTAARHMFFKLEHVDGDVLAWDGIGEYVFDGDVYLGVAGLAQIQGVSNSHDLQNHRVECTLNAVPLPALAHVNPSIRDAPAQLAAVWIDGDTGEIVASRIMFAGLGDVLRSRVDGETLTITASIRALAADWSTVPRAYYNDVDQQRRFPGDTGCQFTTTLENAVIAGWQATPGSAADLLYRRFSVFGAELIADGDGVAFGDPSRGVLFLNSSGSLASIDGSDTYRDSVNDNIVTLQSVGQPLLCNGVSVQINGSDQAASADGNTIGHGGSTDAADTPRRIGAIASTGTDTTTQVRLKTALGKWLPFDSSNPPSGDDFTGLAIGEEFVGLAYAVDETTTYTSGPNSNIYSCSLYRSDGVRYVEETTGLKVHGANTIAAMTAAPSGTYRLWVVAGYADFYDLTVSSTGYVITSRGNKIVAEGTSDYLRLWA